MHTTEALQTSEAMENKDLLSKLSSGAVELVPLYS